jgi:hypothetical protein
VLAGISWGLLGCAEQARISLFDDVIIEDAGFAPPDELPAEPEDAAVAPEDSGPSAPNVPIEQDPVRPGPDGSSTSTGELVTSSTLALRYDFEGSGTVVEDRVGEADAVIRGGAALDTAGGLSLDGYDDYVDMPNGVLSSRRSVTIMAWLRWDGGPCWQRVFDFGSTDAGEGQVGRATTSLFLTPAACPNGVALSMTEREADQQAVAASQSMPTGRTIQVVLVLDGDNGQSALFIDGVREATAPNAHLMADLNDVNNWLGRSQWVQDNYLSARYDELRIYDGALRDQEIAALAERGPDRP